MSIKDGTGRLKIEQFRLLALLGTCSNGTQVA